MGIRHFVPTLVAAGLIGSGSLTAAEAVEVDARPERVSVRHAYETVRYTLSGVEYSPEQFEWCSVTLEHKASRVLVDSDFPDEYETTGTLRVYDYVLRPGVHQVKAECYWSGTSVDEITIKFGSRATIKSAARDRRRVTITGLARRWSSSTSTWERWRKTPVRVQKRTKSGWKTLTEVTTDRRGRVLATVRSSSRAKWRLTTVENRSTWSDASPVIRR